jgi:phosphate starvation-inducible protein PhoH
MIKNINGVAEFKFTGEDIVRNKILIEIVDRYEKYKSENND